MKNGDQQKCQVLFFLLEHICRIIFGIASSLNRIVQKTPCAQPGEENIDTSIQVFQRYINQIKENIDISIQVYHRNSKQC